MKKFLLFVGLLLVVLVMLSMNVVEGNIEDVGVMNEQLSKLNELKGKMTTNERNQLTLDDLKVVASFSDYHSIIKTIISQNKDNRVEDRKVNGGKKIQSAIDNLTRRRDHVKNN